MKKMFKDKPTAIMVIAVGVMLLIALFDFLFTKDAADSFTGLRTLGQEGWNFWIWAIVLPIAAGVLVYFGVRIYNKNAEPSTLKAFLIAAIAFLVIAFGKGCTDKANKGVTTENGRPVPVATDSTRIPAEDLIPKK